MKGEKMGKFRTMQSVMVTAESDARKVFDYLTKNYPDYNWDMETDVEICGSSYVTGYYEPEVRYTKNGDGSPAVWELDDGFDELWLEEEVKSEIGIDVKVKCELRD